jgi:hypothetical protein
MVSGYECEGVYKRQVDYADISYPLLAYFPSKYLFLLFRFIISCLSVIIYHPTSSSSNSFLLVIFIPFPDIKFYKKTPSPHTHTNFITSGSYEARGDSALV